MGAAHNLYEKETSAHQAGLFGLKLEEVPQEDFYVWDCNWDVFNLFYNLQSQWRVAGMGSATGLDYNAIIPTGKLLGYKKKELKAMFPDLQVMENEALITMGENLKDGNDSGTPD